MGVKQTACTGMAVGGVVVAAKPRFHDDEIHSRFGEGEQAEGREEFEISQVGCRFHDTVGQHGPAVRGQHRPLMRIRSRGVTKCGEV